MILGDLECADRKCPPSCWDVFESPGLVGLITYITIKHMHSTIVVRIMWYIQLR